MDTQKVVANLVADGWSEEAASIAAEALVREWPEALPVIEQRCSFCGDRDVPLDKWGHCQRCEDGMARTKGD